VRTSIKTKQLYASVSLGFISSNTPANGRRPFKGGSCFDGAAVFVVETLLIEELLLGRFFNFFFRLYSMTEISDMD